MAKANSLKAHSAEAAKAEPSNTGDSAPISPAQPSQVSAKQPQDGKGEPLEASTPQASKDAKHITLRTKTSAVDEGRCAVMAKKAG